MKKYVLLCSLTVTLITLLPIVSAQFNTTLNCFTTGSFADISCAVGGGFYNLLGNPVMMTLFLMLFGVMISWRLKLSLELTAIFMFALVYISVLAFAPTWMKYAVTILLGIAVGYGFYKFLRR